MSNEARRVLPDPTVEQLKKELKRVRRQQKRRKSLLQMLAVFAVMAVAVVLTVFALPVLRIQGNSMNPTLEAGDIVVAVRGSEFAPGDMVAFEQDNKILVKRIIAASGDVVDIGEDGTVTVNGSALQEDYIAAKHSGEPDIELPYSVPANRYFVLGDDRAESVDSRYTALGCVAQEQIIGSVRLRIWPIVRMKAW